MNTELYSAKADVLIEAVPYIQQFKDAVVLIKFGGSTMEDPEVIHHTLQDVAFMAAAGMRPIVVHGGGKAINAELKKQNIEPRFINGLRYTCERTIQVVDKVLHDVVNAELVAFMREECKAAAVAVSGKDILRCRRLQSKDEATGAPVDLGYVGRVVNVDTPQLEWILARHEIPVIAPLACDANGQVYNINADMAACVIAAQMKVGKLVFLSDVPGIMKDISDISSLISTISCHEIERLTADGVISGGMIPKVNSAREAIEAGVGKVHLIDGRVRHALLLEVFTREGVGTQIIP